MGDAASHQDTEPPPPPLPAKAQAVKATVSAMEALSLRPSSRASDVSASSSSSAATTHNNRDHLISTAGSAPEKLTRPPLTSTDWEKWLATYQAGEWQRLQHEELEQGMDEAGRARRAEGGGILPPVTALPVAEVDKKKAKKLRPHVINDSGEMLDCMSEFHRRRT